MSPEIQVPFMVCPKCQRIWPSRDAMLEDPLIRVRYFHAIGSSHSSGIFIFTHQRCGSSFGLDFAVFDDLSQFSLLTVSDCSLGAATEFCLAAQQRMSAPPLCSCRAIWNILRILQLWPKKLTRID